MRFWPDINNLFPSCNNSIERDFISVIGLHPDLFSLFSALAMCLSPEYAVVIYCELLGRPKPCLASYQSGWDT
jgi:hypothetical protein